MLLTINVSFAQSNEVESLHRALVAFYESTNGDQWSDNSGWNVKEVPTTMEQFGDWYGITVDDGELVRMILNRNNLVGTIPPELGDLEDLEILHLGTNNLTGEIPSEIGNLVNLNLLYLMFNSLSGEMPSELGNLTHLTGLRFSRNELSSRIPPEFGNLSNIVMIDLSHNSLTGSIPPQLGNLSNLYELNLLANQLSGEIPAELGLLKNIASLYLWSNELSGGIPPELGNLTSMSTLTLSENNLSGAFPRSFMQLESLATFFWQFNRSHLCAPNDDEFQTWLSTVLYRGGLTCRIFPFASMISDLSYPNGQAITPWVLPEAIMAMPPITYSISPELPKGLSFDASTRTMSGTPSEVTPAMDYKYTAMDTESTQITHTFSMEIAASVAVEESDDFPVEFVVHSNYPNPFQNSTHLRFNLPWSARVTIDVLDVTGRQVYSISPVELPAGWNQEIELNATNLPSGMYLYRLTASSPQGQRADSSPRSDHSDLVEPTLKLSEGNQLRI